MIVAARLYSSCDNILRGVSTKEESYPIIHWYNVYHKLRAKVEKAIAKNTKSCDYKTLESINTELAKSYTSLESSKSQLVKVETDLTEKTEHLMKISQELRVDGMKNCWRKFFEGFSHISGNFHQKVAYERAHIEFFRHFSFFDGAHLAHLN